MPKETSPDIKDIDNVCCAPRLLHGDCLIEMQNIPDKSIDMILCDLPYGTTACKWDVVIPFEPLWKEYKRVIKDRGCIALFGSEPFSSHLRMSNIKDYKYDWIWEKPNGTNFLNYQYQPAKVFENICVFGLSATSYSRNGNMSYYPQMVQGNPYECKQGRTGESHGRDRKTKERRDIKTVSDGQRYPKNIIKNKSEKGFHPTQKPVSLLEYLIKTYTNEGGIVLDNCAGSGTTGLACQNLDRNCILIEKEEKYVEIIEKRLNIRRER